VDAVLISLSLTMGKITILAIISCSSAIKVYESTLSLEEDANIISGLHLIDQPLSPNVKDITFCMRFNYKLLGEYEFRSPLIHIENFRNGPKTKEVNREWNVGK